MTNKIYARLIARTACISVVMFACIGWGTTLASAAEVNVGPGRSLKTLQAGVAAARANDRIVLDAGVYLDDVSNIDKPLTIEGAGSGAVLRITKPISNRKGILVVNADLTLRKVTFEGAFVTDADGKNGAGIRHQAGKLVIDTCVFNNNQNGILANPNKDASITIRRSAFNGNGGGDGYTHAIYVNAIARLDVSDSTFAGTKVGHNIKSRALQTTITDTILDDGVSGTTSYAVDLPNGGKAVLKGLRITQGPRTSNNSMIAFGAEPPLHEASSLTVSGSTFVNQASNSVGINNFSSIPVTSTDNAFENVGQVTKGLVQMNRSSAPTLREGVVFTGADPNTRSYLRFHNTGTSPGTVTVRLYDSRDGRLYGAWTSPSIAPNAAPQFSITELEAALQIRSFPRNYAARIEPAMTGTFQHVLHRPDNGVLTNLSTCGAGVARAGRQIAGIHTSNLDEGYPASVIVQNAGAIPGAARIGIYNARDGQRLGSYTTAEISVDGELILSVSALERGAGVVPAWDMGHWVLKIENDFAGTLQQMFINLRAAVVSDMTTVCTLNAATADVEPVVRIGGVLTEGDTFNSALVVHNTSQTDAPIKVDIFDALSGSKVGQWESARIASNASAEIRVASIVPPATAGGPRSYRLNVESGFSGFVQHVIHNASGVTLTNVSTCDGGTTASLTEIASLKASTVAATDIPVLVLHNAGQTSAPATFAVFNAQDGQPLGQISTPKIPAGASYTMTAVDFEYGLGFGGNSPVGAFNVKLLAGFEGSLQHVLISTTSGAVSDMTTACAVGPA